MQGEVEEVESNTKFKSPVPMLIRFRNLVFGKKKPDIHTRITFYINGVIALSFLLWNLIGYFAISLRDLFTEMKNVPIESIIHARGLELGFHPEDFVSRLATLYGISVICWLLVIAGLILLYRKRHQFIYFILGGIIFSLGMQIIYLNFQYFSEDTSTFDKILVLILVASTVIHAALMRNEKNGGSISFFGEDEEEVQ
ncbi:MAG: hypothetical protein ACI865_000887 [Flavobacteriaceae bacterium]|jgi:hypothetical protein